MSSLRVACTADWHLSSSRNRIDSETGLNSRLLDFYRCARFCVEDGIARGAELILHAGDVANSPRWTPTERRLAIEAFEPAIRAGIPVLVIEGNHDQTRSPQERGALDTLKDVEGLTIVDRPCMMEAWRENGARLLSAPAAPEQARWGDTTELQIACLPWPNKSLLLANEDYRKLDPGQLNELVRAKLMDVLRGLAAQLRTDIPSVLLMHAGIDTAAMGSQNRLAMLGGEWTLNLHDLAALDFDALLAGHYHRPQLLNEDPWIGYVGSPEAVGFGEEEEEKSYLLLGCGDPFEGISIDRVPTPYRHFLTLTPASALEIGSLAGAIVRVKCEQADATDLVALRKHLEAAGASEIQIETQRAETVRRHATAISADTAFEQSLDAWLEQRPELKPMREELLAEGRAVESEVANA